jgi:transcription elongation factor GreA
MSDDVVMSAADHRALQAELEELETTARAEMAERIKTAREWGDLKENAEYHDAKNAQAMLETRILRLRDRLLRAQIVEVTEGAEAIGFGSRVRVRDRGSGRESNYTLVSAVDADAAAGRLSIESPVGAMLVGARVGDVVEVATPKGPRTLEVLLIA